MSNRHKSCKTVQMRLHANNCIFMIEDSLRESRWFLGSLIFSWEQRKLGDIATFINGRAYSREELLDEGKYKVLRVGNFYTNDSWYYSDMELGEKYYANKGDLLYTWSATFGPHIWLGDKVIYHYHIWKVELSALLDKQFAVQILDYDKAKIMSDHNGSTMIHITKGGMENKSISTPSLSEQKKIGKFFCTIDHLITLHQRKPFPNEMEVYLCLKRLSKQTCFANIMQNGLRCTRRER